MQGKQVRTRLHGWDHLPMPSLWPCSLPSSQEPADPGVLIQTVLQCPPACLLWALA